MARAFMPPSSPLRDTAHVLAGSLALLFTAAATAQQDSAKFSDLAYPVDSYELVGDTRAMRDEVRRIVEAGGGSTADIVRMAVWLKDRAQRQPLNDQWLTMFPDPHDRPARLSVQASDLTGGILVQCEVTAYIGA